jgi:RNA polymerase sigma-70 factor (ECF subfamily)
LAQENQAGSAFPLSNEAAIELIRKIEGGNQSALGFLYDRTSPLLYGLIFKVIGDKAQAEEILLETYISIWKKSVLYDPGLLPLEWLLTVARTKAVARVNWHKKSSRKRELPIGNRETAASVAPEQRKLVRSAIKTLAPAQQEILYWSYYSGLSCSEIAERIGKPVGAVKTHARLGLTKLTELIRPLFESKTESGIATGGRIET